MEAALWNTESDVFTSIMELRQLCPRNRLKLRREAKDADNN